MTPGEPVLTVVGEDDWELWRDLRRWVLSTDPDAFGSTLELEQRYDEAAWRARVGRGRSVVAWLGGRPVGMGGSFEEEPGVLSVVSMWVAPDHRGKGIGRLVLEDVVAAATATGDNLVRLWVSDGNRARVLYERAGFVDTGERAPIRPGATLEKSRMELRGSRTRKVLPRLTSDSTSIVPP